jgi:predicted nucleic acid-binding protein
LTLLDANALLSLVLGQPAEAEVSALLRRGNCAVPAPCLAEVVDTLVRNHQIERELVARDLGVLIDEVVAVVSTDLRIAWRAGELHAEHYDRNTTDLSLADCVLLATACSGDEIASSDAAVVSTAGKLGIGVVPLLDSRGRRPDS